MSAHFFEELREREKSFFQTKESERQKALEAADIQTHHAPHMDDPWVAIPMKVAKEKLKGYVTLDEPFNSIPEITASYGILLEDCGMVFFGKTQREVEDAALAFFGESRKGKQ